jgi:hypothetical protein
MQERNAVMFRPLAVAAVGVLLGVAVGCSLDSFTLTAWGGKGGQEHVVAGSVGVVSQTAEQALLEMNVLGVSKQIQGGVVRLAGTTRSGQRFILVFEQKKTDAGESTTIHLEGADREAEAAFVPALIQAMATVRLKPAPLPPPY